MACIGGHIWTYGGEIESLEGWVCDCGAVKWYEEICPTCQQKVVKSIPTELYDALYGRPKPDWHY